MSVKNDIWKTTELSGQVYRISICSSQVTLTFKGGNPRIQCNNGGQERQVNKCFRQDKTQEKNTWKYTIRYHGEQVS